LFVEPLSIVHSVKESTGQSHGFHRVAWLLFGIIYSFAEGIKDKTNFISKAFEILEKIHKMGT